ncbi:WecB/TagA/CpsF family glycosyltransferase [Rhodopseudomonas sp. HC1]|uniref:WecB/TagA/CpsF family glycosyltransferase n=1 Tax=Rhodopseudomonas infernalis TaxID=2897386 RepID=UPI001EE8E58F|nr:WecB/TagA/CpsF family glycosyltransferase [Rhodopseudomonas infernalis]MCG6205626.1 WecB/TagA/CpsF family glycosyltransferase [Rhodopseudomonas infernalis]
MPYVQIVQRSLTQAAGAERRLLDRRVAPFSIAAIDSLPFGERRVSGERRRTRFLHWKRNVIGGLPIVVADRTETARGMVDEALKRRGLWRYPAYMTSTNGEVTYRCAVDPAEHAMFLQADAIHADGMPHVFVSRYKCDVPLPERVATTDLFHDVAREAIARGASMFMLGASEDSNRLAAELVAKRYPDLKLIGRRNGFFADQDEEITACRQIAELAPDILWVSMGVPREQLFIGRNRHRLTTVGVIKTSGGLFDFLSGSKPRAPQWMQQLGLEWAWRMALEPRRLGMRYLKTNPYAMYLLLTQTTR